MAATLSASSLSGSFELSYSPMRYFRFVSWSSSSRCAPRYSAHRCCGLRSCSQAVAAAAAKERAEGKTQLADQVRSSGVLDPSYDARRAAYDLKKLRGKELVSKVLHSRRYCLPAASIRTIAALVILRERVLRPILAGVGKPKMGRKPKNWAPIDEHYETIRRDMFTLMQDLRITA
jgi:hypothetical protein